jgi:tRNA A37 threonylcarbamoyladenosine modification protein TsaB
VLEARPGEFFTALYQRCGSDLQVRAEPTVLRAEELAQRLSAYPGPVLVAGHAARCARAWEPSPVATALAASEFDEEPQARWVGRLAARRLRAGERDDPLALAPLYGRAPAPTLKRGG